MESIFQVKRRKDLASLLGAPSSSSLLSMEARREETLVYPYLPPSSHSTLYDPLWHRDKKESPPPPPYTHTPIVLLPPPFGVGFTQEFSLLKVRSLKKGYLLNGKKWVFFVNGV